MFNSLQTTAEDLPSPRPSLVFLEGAVVTLLLPALGLIGHTADPFFLRGGFPWLVLSPLLLGLRYGFAHGMGSAAALALLMYAFHHLGRPEVAIFPGGLVLGLLFVGMVAGEFCDQWHRRLHRLSEINFQHNLLVQRFNRSYQLLSLSHERLERRVLDNTRSLRQALTFLRECAANREFDSPDSRVLHHMMMEVLSSFGQLQVASLYRIDEYGILIPRAVASLGNPKQVPIDDPMLIEACKTKQLTCIHPEETQAARLASENLVAVLPLTDVHGRLWGVVTVQAMPFQALSRDNLNLLAVLGGHLGDVMALSVGGGEQHFHTSLLRCQRDAHDYGLEAALLALVVDPKQAPLKLGDELLELQRGLDQQWLTHNRRGQLALVRVMPLTDAEGVRGYLQRIDTWAKERYGKPLSDLGVAVHQVILDGNGRAEDKLAALKEATDSHVA